MITCHVYDYLLSFFHGEKGPAGSSLSLWTSILTRLSIQDNQQR